jgi:hypothetical protein
MISEQQYIVSSLEKVCVEFATALLSLEAPGAMHPVPFVEGVWEYKNKRARARMYQSIQIPMSSQSRPNKIIRKAGTGNGMGNTPEAQVASGTLATDPNLGHILSRAAVCSPACQIQIS